MHGPGDIPPTTDSAPGPGSARALRDRLLDAQFELQAGGRAAVVVLATGIPLAGRTEAVGRIAHGLDPQFLSTHARPLSAEPLGAPFFRWWNAVPARGRMSLVYDGWYEDLVACRRDPPQQRRGAVRALIESINDFERFLRDSGVLLVKLHFGLSALKQRRRIEHCLADEARRWRVGPDDDWFNQHHAAQCRRLARIRAATDRPGARWREIDGADSERALTDAARRVLAVLERAAARAPEPTPRPLRAAASPRVPRSRPGSGGAPRVGGSLAEAQGALALTLRRHRFAKRGLIVVLEGMDAAGKSSAIRACTEALDPRQYRVVPVGAPTEEQQRYPYLHRFWSTLPESGEAVFYDRSWYGRVLVERVDGLCGVAEGRRAYREIRGFESDLAARGFIVIKFWLAVSRSVQLERLRERSANPAKRFKIGPADWHARRRWRAYQTAARAAIDATGRHQAPWFVVPADDKHEARLRILAAIGGRLQAALEHDR